jgi:2-dehydro-3-deoxyphosphogluconate aldolase/(4S)-4-hydroxy-2-oxoglutarate aldolase
VTSLRTCSEVARHFDKADPERHHGRRQHRAPRASTTNGAKFVVGPILNADVAKVCNRRAIPQPGLRLRERNLVRAELGEIVKVSRIVGRWTEFVKNVMGPMPWTRIMPTGGVEPPKNPTPVVGAGIVACGIGNNLITKELLAKQDYAGVEAKVRDTVKLIKTFVESEQT